MTDIPGQYLEVILPTLQPYDAKVDSEDWSDSYLDLLELKDQVHNLQETVEEIKDLLLASNGSGKDTSNPGLSSHRDKPLGKRVPCSTPGCPGITRSKGGRCKACRNDEKSIGTNK
jgi:hypothetical protein